MWVSVVLFGHLFVWRGNWVSACVACGHVHAAAFQVERGGAHAGERDDGEDDAVRVRAGGCHDLVGLGGRFDRGLLGGVQTGLAGIVVMLRVGGLLGVLSAAFAVS